MFLAGLQKLSLLDYPGLVAATVFTAGCNLRCPFCHNSGLVLPEELPAVGLETEEVLAFLKTRRGVLDGICVSGGEPLLHSELADFLRQLRALGYRIKLDTNGSFPKQLRALIEEGLLDYVAMDVKNGPALYAETAGIPGLKLEAFEESRDLLLSGTVEYEFRTTVVRGLHTEESLLAAADWIAGARVWYLQQYRDSGSILCPDGLSSFSGDEMNSLLSAVREKLPEARLRGI